MKLEKRIVLRRLLYDVRNKPYWVRNLNRLLIRVQICFNLFNLPINSAKTGAAWFSITNGLVKELISSRNIILKRYKYVLLPDEMFLQTYLYENNMLDRVYNINSEFESCCRHIDWKRGNPYVWQDNDFEELVNSKYLWARKFSESNMDLILKIENHIKGNLNKE